MWARVRIWGGLHPVRTVVLLNLIYRALADGERGTDLVWSAVIFTVFIGPVTWWGNRRAGRRQMTDRAIDPGRSLRR
ncbi:MAG: hypothetical protein DLM60_18105 [Pseudonocardiales bacterium]|nr:MAG: hypothetical protein DLM60_18105 [Pseudonocardiales bacterium]